MNEQTAFLLFGAALVGIAFQPLYAADNDNASAELRFTSGIGIAGISSRGRSTVSPDPVQAEIANGTWHAPTAGDTLLSPRGSNVTWEAVQADTNGVFTGSTARGGYIFVTHVATEDSVMLLNAAGHNMVYANGEPRNGDVYNYGYVQVPVAIHRGTNEFLFATGRGRLRASLSEPRAPQMILSGDPTLPDLLTGDRSETWGAVVVVNSTKETTAGLEITAEVNGRRHTTKVPKMLPLSARKMGFQIAAPSLHTGGETTLKLTLHDRENHNHVVDQAEFKLRIREPQQTRKITFVSDIDGSVQYYAVNPASGEFDEHNRPAMFFSLHGASVEAIGQADAYSPKKWGVIVTPTNRRPYGFDWEEWGRMDALEVLNLATAKFRPSPDQVYLTGHSMGGHGTWNFGANFPNRFAAIGPSAGWISFWSYAGSSRSEEPNAIEQMLLRGMAPADTMGLSTNYSQLGVYILHGDADDNVPIKEARTMRAHLQTFLRDLDWHEEPGAGHWWDNSDEPGAACVDWPPMFDFFARHRLPADDEVRQVNFTTMNPGVSATDHWVTIAQQQHALQASRVNIEFDPQKRRFTGTTKNVATLELRFPARSEAGDLILALDDHSQTNAVAAGRTNIWLHRVGEDWETGTAPAASEKGPNRAGPFKEAFQHRMVFVYATHGTPEENAWAFDKARFDAEQFQYRGNGSIDVLADTEFAPAKFPDRSVILYGNRDSNAAWSALLADSPVQIGRDEIRLSDHEFRGADLGCVFMRPRRDSDTASVAVVSGTGINGLRLTDRLSYFTSGTGFPDCLILSPEILEKGTAGILAAGFFGNDWSVERGEIAFHEQY
ncbi:prolyl oligopeptidase family serine peptidase [bacterium]|nr:prolyl oligopeptidase family serine peptidase [bacterium]